MSSSQKTIVTASLILMAAVMIGAFGAHGLEKMISGKYLATFQTGVKYHFYHGFGLLMVGILEKLYQKNFLYPKLFGYLGIALFSFFCYLYAILQIKALAMIVPFGGVCFILMWLSLAVVIRKQSA